ncbi:MAG: PRC-barrel domain-containing protein, partial [Chloroflexota bacterium]
MRIGKELIGKPIYSVTDGRQLGSVKDLYLNLDLDRLNGVFLGREGLLTRKSRIIVREDIAVLGIDSVLVTDSDVVTSNEEKPEVETWLRREDLQGREINTAGGTKVGTVGDVLLDEEAQVVGFALARVYVEGPVAESRIVRKEAVLETGAKTGNITIDLTIAEVPATEPVNVEESSEVEEEVEEP